MKTEWVQTGSGTYMQLFVPDWEGIHRMEPPTEAEQITAAMNYIATVYAVAFALAVDKIAEAFITTGEAMVSYGETLAVLNDSLAMEVIAEARSEDDL